MLWRLLVFLLCSILLLLLLVPAVNTATAPVDSTVFTNRLTELLNVAVNGGIIDSTQAQSLLSLAEQLTTQQLVSDREDRILLSTEEEHSLLAAMYNRLTLLNVLYFGGSLLIIGAYSLLMNLAWEHCNPSGFSCIMLAQTILSGALGVLLWQYTEQYQFLGGLLCSISTGLVPYTVYWIQKALQVWPQDDPGVFQGFRIYVRPGWVAMEIATVVVGFLYLLMIRFPFLLAPVSFCLWFLSMDIVPLLQQWSRSNGDIFELRRRVSIAFGLALMIAGRVMEYLLGNEPDFGFWLYLFGLISFWFALVLWHPSVSNLSLSLSFLINIGLVLIGSHLDRTTFHLFGTVGVVMTTLQGFDRQSDTIGKSFFLWLLKALATISLLSQAMKRDGSIEVINAVICLASFNMEGLLYVPEGEMYSLFILLTNLGFVATVPSLDHTLSLWIVEVQFMSQLLSLFSLFLLLFHTEILKYRLARDKLRKASSIAFLAYRCIISMGVCFLMVFLRQHWFMWVGGVCLPLVAMVIHPNYDESIKYRTPSQFIILVLSIILSIYFSSNLLYLISCLCMGVATLSILGRHNWEMAYGCILSLLLILISVPLQSKFIIAIGGIYIFGYLSHLAYVVFKRSVLFPLVLVGLGITLIYTGVIYQQYQESLYYLGQSLIPEGSYSLSDVSFDLYPYFKEARFSQLYTVPYLWLMYPGMMTHALVKESFPYASIACAVGMLLVLLAMIYIRIVTQYCPDLSSVVKVTYMRISLNQSGTQNGMIITIKGSKPSELVLPNYISLNIKGEQFWTAMKSHFNGLLISLVKSTFLPYRLTPHFISCVGFEKGSDKFTATITLGTGEQGGPSLGRQTIINNARKVQESLATMHCCLLYSNAFNLPYSPLCSYDLTVTDACQMLLLSEPQ